MKKIFVLGLFLSLAFSNAFGQQLDRKAKDSTANSATKYITYPAVPNGTVGFVLSGLKAATGGGTVSGYAILQIRTDTLPTQATSVYEDYVYPGTTKRDTLFFTDLTTIQQHTWPIPFPFFNGGRFKIVTSGTQKLYLYPALFKR